MRRASDHSTTLFASDGLSTPGAKAYPLHEDPSSTRIAA
jgi:hypothetical protein